MRTITNLIILAGMLLILPSTLLAQQPLEDVVYLKNGSIIRGQIMEQIPGEPIRIELLGGTELVYSTEEIERITKEPSKSPTHIPKQKEETYIKHKGFKSINEIGIMSGSTEFEGQNEVNFALTMQTINGYQFFPQLRVGLGMGIDIYKHYDQVFTPLFFSTGGEILKKRVSPTWFANVGYAPEWSAVEDSDLNAKGGLMMQYGAGIKINTTSKVGVVIHVSYKLQKSQLKRTYPWTEDYFQTVDRKYQRIAVTAGISF